MTISRGVSSRTSCSHATSRPTSFPSGCASPDPWHQVRVAVQARVREHIRTVYESRARHIHGRQWSGAWRVADVDNFQFAQSHRHPPLRPQSPPPSAVIADEVYVLAIVERRHVSRASRRVCTYGDWALTDFIRATLWGNFLGYFDAPEVGIDCSLKWGFVPRFH